jgi:hypothetical protein
MVEPTITQHGAEDSTIINDQKQSEAEYLCQEDRD